jgi:hypothetical protein
MNERPPGGPLHLLKRWYAPLGAVGLIAIVAVALVHTPRKKAAVASPQERASSQCAVSVTSDFLRAKIAVSQAELQTSFPVRTIESIMALRRLEEDYCLKLAKCEILGETDQLIAIRLPLAFDSCLGDEARDHYRAETSE